MTYNFTKVRMNPLKKTILITGVGAFFLYVIMLWFRPQISWCDDTFFVDWARVMAINGHFVSHPWPNSMPDYVPLYPVLMAGWIKILGFSYFKVHLLDIFLAFINHCLLLNILVNRNIINKSTSIIGISYCIWFGHTIFWINNAGRPEVLTLTMTIIALYYLFKLYYNKSNTNYFGFFVASVLVLLSGVQGFVALLFITVILLLHNYKKSINEKKHIVVALFGGGILSLSFTCFFFYFTGARMSFLPKAIHFSKTANYLNVLYKKVILRQNVEIQPGNDSTIFDRFVELTQNHEYCLLALLFLTFLIVFRKKILRYNWSIFEKTIFISSLLLPLFYELAGRYPLYYTGFAYYLVVISLFILIDRLINEKIYSRIIVSVLGIILFSNFVLSPPIENVTDFRVVDFNRNVDKRVLNDIKNSGISFDQPVVIPNEWYYMLVEKYEENMYYQSSGNYPPNLEYVVEIPSHEYINDGWNRKFHREMIRNNGYLYIYKVLRRKP